MALPFTVEQFYRVFTDYNLAVWPAQCLLLGLALVALWCVRYPRAWSGRIVSGILALLWIWMALAYHIAFFARINSLAYGFAALSLAGAVVFIWQGVVHDRLQFSMRGGLHILVGIALIVFALLLYPAWSWFAGHRYPAMPSFGLPCPTTIFTIGILALRCTPSPRGALIVPVIWSAIGGQAAVQLDVSADFGLIVAGVVGLILLLRRQPAHLACQSNKQTAVKN